MFDPVTLIVIFLIIVCISSFVQGFSGFGAPLVMVPLLIIFISSSVAVPIALFFNILISTIILVEARKHFSLKKIWPLLIASIFGIPFGILIFTSLNTFLLKVSIGLLIIFFGIALLFGIGKVIKKEKMALLSVGFLGGLLNGFMAASAPPVALLLDNQKTKKDAFRTTLVTYFIILNIATIVLFYLNGLISFEIINYLTFLFPAAIIGTLLGIKLSKQFNDYYFRKIVLVMIIFVGIVAILSAF